MSTKKLRMALRTLAMHGENIDEAKAELAEIERVAKAFAKEPLRPKPRVRVFQLMESIAKDVP